MSATAPAAHVALMAPLRFSEDTPAEPGNDRLPATIACPSCHQDHTKHVRITAESARRATTRPVTPERIATCPGGHDLAILSRHPASDPKEAGR